MASRQIMAPRQNSKFSTSPFLPQWPLICIVVVIYDQKGNWTDRFFLNHTQKTRFLKQNFANWLSKIIFFLLTPSRHLIKCIHSNNLIWSLGLEYISDDVWNLYTIRSSSCFVEFFFRWIIKNEKKEKNYKLVCDIDIAHSQCMRV